MRNGEQLERLVRRLQDSGLGEKVQSWISTDPNEPIGGDDVEQAFAGEIDAIASRAGVSPEEEAADEIARVLPDIVDKLTPAGVVPVPAGTTTH